MALVIGLDIGTTKICALALDMDTNETLAVASRANSADVPDLPSGWHEQSPAVIWSLCQEVLREVTALHAVETKQVCGIGISGQMHGVLLVAADGTSLTNLITWRDARTLQAESGNTLACAKEGLAEVVNNRGCDLHAGYGGATLHWLMLNNRLSDTSAKAVSMADYVAGQLCGVWQTEPTHAASWGLYDLDADNWDEKAIESLKIPRALLPEIYPSATPLAPLTPSVAEELNLPEDVLVASPVGDNQASVAGVTGMRQDICVFNLGTGGQVSVPSVRLERCEGMETRPMPFGGYLQVGASLCGGWAFAYLRQFLQNAVFAFAQVPLTDSEVYEIMNRLPHTPDNGLQVDTRFLGTRQDASQRGRITGIDASNFTPGNFVYAFTEGMVRELAEMALQAGLGETREIIACGNAARHNPHVLPLIEKQLKRPCRLGDGAEEAARGAALCAAQGLMKDER